MGVACAPRVLCGFADVPDTPSLGQNFHEFGDRNKALEAEKMAMAQHVAGLKGKMAR